MTDEKPFSLVRQKPRRRVVRNLALKSPIARVSVDTGLAHLDRPFDYLIDESQSDKAQPGVRVRVPFSGRSLDGFLLDRLDKSEHATQFLTSVTSNEIVLKPEIIKLAQLVADRYAGTFADVLRSAVPPRHAQTEAKTGLNIYRQEQLQLTESISWSAFPDYSKYLRAMKEGRAPRLIWSALSGVSPLDQISQLSGAALGMGVGVLILVPDQDMVTRVAGKFAAIKDGPVPAVLVADDGPGKRYASFLAVARGQAALCVGTRSAVFAPVANLGLIILWDDADDSYEEPHSPGWHAREVSILRSRQENVALAIGGWSVSVESSALIQTGWAHLLHPAKEVVRQSAPRISALGEDVAYSRLPSRAWQNLGRALETGPVLVLVPRKGHTPALRCATCRNAALCQCGGRLELLSSHAVPSCHWCGHTQPEWSCKRCGGSRFRAAVIGNERTAQELGRAFPGTTVKTSTGASRIAQVGSGSAIVVSTPGAEPWCEAGYAGGVILDGWAFFDRPVLRASEDAASRWFKVASLLRPGASLFLGAELSHPLVQAISRWDAAWLAERELSERRELGLPPVARVAVIQGELGRVRAAVDDLQIAGVRVSGPRLITAEKAEAVVRVPMSQAAELTAAMRALVATSSSAKLPPIRIRIDPLTL